MKSAVEWLIGEISKDRVGQAIIKTFLKEFEQAKEMQKQQIVDAFEIGYENGACVNENNDFYHGGNYYNETYKDKL